MKFKQLVMPLAILGMMLIITNIAFGQGVTNVYCGISTPLGPTSTGTQSGHTEPIAAGPPLGTPGVSPPTDGGGTLRVTCINIGGTGSTTDPGVVVLTISLGTHITNTTAHPSAAAAIRLGPTTGDFAGNVGIASISASAGTIVVGVGNTPTSSTGSSAAPTVGAIFTAGTTSTFDILGVLVSLCPNVTNATAACNRTTPVQAFLTASVGINTGNYPPAVSTLTNPSTVIAAVSPGLVDPTVPSSGLPAALGAGIAGGPAVLNSAGGTVKGNFTIRIQENYADMFRSANQFNGPTTASVFPQSNTSSVQLNINIQNIPAGLNLSTCNAIITDTSGTPTTGTPFLTVANVVTAQLLTISFLANVNLQAVDVVWVTCGTVAAPIGVGTATVPLPSQPVTAQVTLSPIGASLSSGLGNPPLTGLTTGNIPRYQQVYQPATALTVVLFPPSNTILLLNFAAVSPGYNTGLAIANTTIDPYTPAGGGAVASSGTISFLLVKNDGTSRTYTTSTNTVGTGLNSSGVLVAGGTYTVNVSELLTAANFPAPFIGYIFITANFTHAHGAATIYETANSHAVLSSPVVVMPPISTAAPRGSPDFGAGLGQ
jgi:hypothetical protein